jgi:hypothetical protein
MSKGVEFKRLTEVGRSEIIELMNDPLVKRQMPLAPEHFSASDCETFVASKEQLWTEHGYGPWALVVDGRSRACGTQRPGRRQLDCRCPVWAKVVRVADNGTAVGEQQNRRVGVISNAACVSTD